MARWDHDEVDVACGQWASQWCSLYQRDPQQAREYLGALRSTLGSRRDLHACSRTNRLDQHWPEGFLGNGLVVAVALQYADFIERELIYRHYLERRFDVATGDAVRRLAPRKTLAARMGMHPSRYAYRLQAAKSWIRAALCLDIKELGIARGEVVQHGQALELSVANS